ncbi:hypothetical protein IQB76_03720 [Leptospira borgpetersenii serovar Hardjo-bovis]|uniref:Uncharacterized protein n=2 Tax=Leptospira borgpetersenii serovar Hardjo-bovis TaxID=338217 RepID=Q04VH9_LEPBJ|nr:Hypothetical protein LBJ_0374 [Leptospira borgpetersenii serovar Hardjo-bovis str. JB197]ABJ80050.1 Hypothetical protein LBL_2703 [Leptospira borgpetersenii serovar Hardjo-bovis str. L550]AMX59487.1 hypothetical protein LBK6_14510 [Leptospira borgpetersenii serovar Hardjo]AWV71203.1 hypothetical protein B9T54_15540 [Leptospira borgpetersenii serovar Hardjo-bovis]TQE52762.1 hypothetical protein FFZ96_15950 [Leptospira borgpetersenii]
MWELPRKLDNNKTYSKIDDRQKGRELPFYEKFKMNISVEVLRPALSHFTGKFFVKRKNSPILKPKTCQHSESTFFTNRKFSKLDSELSLQVLIIHQNLESYLKKWNPLQWNSLT